MVKTVFHGIVEVKGNRFYGRALVPGISRNGNLYTPDQMELSENLLVPLRADWEHTDENLGSVIFNYDKELQELLYEGLITSQERFKTMKEGKYQVSIEADSKSIQHVCTPNRCYNMPIGLKWEGLGITQNPGVTASTLFLEHITNEELIKLKESCVSECQVDKDLEKKYAPHQVKEDGCVQDYIQGKIYTEKDIDDQATAICHSEFKMEINLLKRQIEEIQERIKPKTCETCGKLKKLL